MFLASIKVSLAVREQAYRVLGFPPLPGLLESAILDAALTPGLLIWNDDNALVEVELSDEPVVRARLVIGPGGRAVCRELMVRKPPREPNTWEVPSRTCGTPC